jgi:hypothetical protein
MASPPLWQCAGLLQAAPPAAGPSRSTLFVHTSDGEWFPVKRKLLRPCIALARAVRSEAEGEAEVSVDVDTCTFDRWVGVWVLAPGVGPRGWGVLAAPAGAGSGVAAASAAGVDCRLLQQWDVLRAGWWLPSAACYSPNRLPVPNMPSPLPAACWRAAFLLICLLIWLLTLPSLQGVDFFGGAGIRTRADHLWPARVAAPSTEPQHQSPPEQCEQGPGASSASRAIIQSCPESSDCNPCFISRKFPAR